MELGYIERKTKELNLLREELLKEKNSHHENTQTLQSSYITKKYKRKFLRLPEMKVACILDEFTYSSFEPECEIRQVTPHNWFQELVEFQPDLFFFESAWSGVEGLWSNKINFLTHELIQLLTYLSQQDIPIVFWNKEDPVHFATFLDTARYADFVFTTDIDCIKDYKSMLKHDRVYFMPFSAQTKYHNPLEKYERKDKFSFAGAYYKRYPERVRDLETFIKTITITKEVDIYDRNNFNNDPNYRFPSSYNRLIVGNLKPCNIDKAYKGYRFNINMNSVKESQSMCARRIYELLASNTITVSNYSKALRNLFGDLVICTDDAGYLSEELRKFDDNEYYNKWRLQGLRKVLSEHTCQDRLHYIINKVFTDPLEFYYPKVVVFSVATDERQLSQIFKHYRNQKYQLKTLYILTHLSLENFSADIFIVNDLSIELLTKIQEEYDYISFFSPLDYYGPNYIVDFVLSLKYSDLPVFCKGTYFMNIEGRINKVNTGEQYKQIDKSRVRTSFLRLSDFACEQVLEYASSVNNGIITVTALSIDEYNYCMNVHMDEYSVNCEIVDDLIIVDTGLSMSFINSKAELITGSHNRLKKIFNDEKNGILQGTFHPLNKSSVLLITNNYPEYTDLYGNAFIHTRLSEYKAHGMIVDVFKLNDAKVKGYSEFNGVDITTGRSEELINILSYGSYNTLLIHFLSETIWNAIKNCVEGKKIIIWVHGSEIQPWWRREHNFLKKEINDAKMESERRVDFWRQIFNLSLNGTVYNLHFVFVSNYLANEVFSDLGIVLPKDKYSIIHNYINPTLFKYDNKNSNLRKKILSIRPFTNRNYANDLTVKAILELSKEPFFENLEFRIIGEGKLFKSTIKPIKKFKNVLIEKKFCSQFEIAQLHKEYGIFLVPTRMDTQGVSRDEAMSSGLVPVTNNVAAIPEFLDSRCGILVDEEDYKGLAEGIKKLYHSPDLFDFLSRNAAERVKRQSGSDKTIMLELELIKTRSEYSRVELG
ncbi:glycosyltransferase [Paenibacillus thiaminolyticus]|uniref:glycosyltransferase family protein n=1 Tax=Paenibacillus thiaminolyticus TaxID=49283 RepID=UPI0035A6F01C